MADARAYLKEVLGGVGPGWLELFRDAAVVAELGTLAAALVGERATHIPPPPLVFEALRYCAPGDVSVLILGQDPYPSPGDAMGLSFSTPPGRGCPPSLRRVYRAISACGESAGGAPAHGDLRPWARQGVLLLNAALTLGAGGVGHAQLWEPFTQSLLRAFIGRAAADNQHVDCFLWGRAAQRFGRTIRDAADARAARPPEAAGVDAFLPPCVRVLEHSHPSPLARAPFEACRHFAAANRRKNVRKIVWDSHTPQVAFSDGSCGDNGGAAPDATYAALVVRGPAARATIVGRVRPCRYRLVDAARPGRGFEPAGAPCAPSNNRAEYLGLCWCLLVLLRAGGRGPAEVVSDSRLCVETLNTWLPRWRRAGAGWRAEKKNVDLVDIADALLVALRRSAAVTLAHVHAHQARPPPTAPARDLMFWIGNDAADRLAARHRADSPAGDYATRAGGAPVARRLRDAHDAPARRAP